MVKRRTPEIARLISKPQQAQELLECANGFLRAMTEIIDNDTDQFIEDMNKFDRLLRHQIHVKWITAEAVVARGDIALTSGAVASWLGNHLTGVERKLL